MLHGDDVDRCLKLTNEITPQRSRTYTLFFVINSQELIFIWQTEHLLFTHIHTIMRELLQLYRNLLFLWLIHKVNTDFNSSRRWWVHPLNQTRAPTSIMNRVQQLKQHPDRFFELFRMTPTFQYLLNLVINSIRRQDTQMRRAIDAETRLCITLHHLTSGVN